MENTSVEVYETKAGEAKLDGLSYKYDEVMIETSEPLASVRRRWINTPKMSYSIRGVAVTPEQAKEIIMATTNHMSYSFNSEWFKDHEYIGPMSAIEVMHNTYDAETKGCKITKPNYWIQPSGFIGYDGLFDIREVTFDKVLFDCVRLAGAFPYLRMCVSVFRGVFIGNPSEAYRRGILQSMLVFSFVISEGMVIVYTDEDASAVWAEHDNVKDKEFYSGKTHKDYYMNSRMAMMAYKSYSYIY